MLNVFILQFIKTPKIKEWYLHSFNVLIYRCVYGLYGI